MTDMKTKAAVLQGAGRPWDILELDLSRPRPGEALVRMEVAGLCHSDEHMKYGAVRYPAVGGHEGAGIVEEVGEGVTRVAVGDHVAISWIPSCGVCRWCVTGHSNLCDLGANMMTGELANGGFRFRHGDTEVGGSAATGTFSQWTVVDERSLVKVDPDLPLEWVSLVTCAVATGWGSVINAGEARPGDAVVIYGSGGIGMNAVQAAVSAHAGIVAVVDPVGWKLDYAKSIGADLIFESAEAAHAEMWEQTRGVGADLTVVTVGKVTADVVRAAFELTRKGGTIVLTGVSDDVTEATIQLPGSFLTLFQKRIVGSLYGHCNPRFDIPHLLGMARAGKLKLDGLVTQRYSLDEINRGYDDLLDGRNIRGVIIHEH
jgi:NDMA-dependent alcohol dehydrogenase